ncbi:hypothetical protein [Actinomadura fibrosa]|uniref:DUF11 domain-containing protein n=1 Tax=Actinomadura fibrosa TaxID=111802 RepID=A0ABW2XXZ0_9ACTN|nr:hypothetical protein [Actinomadura fibrosa]
MRMREIGPKALVSGAAVALALGTAAAANAVPAGAATARPAAAPPAVQKFVFSKEHPRFDYKNSIGRFHAHVALTGRHAKGYPLSWRFVVNGRKMRAKPGTKAMCEATGQDGRYRAKETIRLGRTWHGTVRGHEAGKPYKIAGACAFRVDANGKPATAVATFALEYTINPDAKEGHGHGH